MTLLSGDSLAVGLAAYIHHVKVDVKVGRRSAEGAAHIRRYKDSIIYVSLGANDSDYDKRFAQRVKLIVAGRKCVAWLSVPKRPHLNYILSHNKRVHLVSGAGVMRSDGIHPGPQGYKVLANRMINACPRASG